MLCQTRDIDVKGSGNALANKQDIGCQKFDGSVNMFIYPSFLE